VVDLAYLRAHPQHLPTFLTHQRIRETPVSGGDICTASRLTLDDGNSVFAKSWPEGDAPAGFFAAEAAGLDWLRAAGAVPVPEVIAALPNLLALEWIEAGPASPAAAERFGRQLAALHRAGAPDFGLARAGFIGALPLPAGTSAGPWSRWFAADRLAPFLRRSADRGALDAADIRTIEGLLATIDRYAGPAEPPARIHGDLWPGNLLWAAAGEVYLIDPAAQGGHRETDLANLALFGGAPHLDKIISGYQQVWPLAPGWQRRLPLHQLHLLLVHTAMFGSGYRGALMAAVRATVEP
jgi:fructosamine-3-kinase